jgi:hypothetical protein
MCKRSFTVDSQIQAKALALKAFLLGSNMSQKTENEIIVRQCLEQLESQPSCPKIIRRQIFYTLILAELFREKDFIVYRKAAMNFGKELEKMKEINPLIYYMKIVDAKERRRSTQDFGDFNCNGSYYPYGYRYGEGVSDISDLLGLKIRTLPAWFDRFLIMDLRTIAKAHGINTD